MSNLINVLITTEKRGVWYAQIEQGTDITQKTILNLKKCRMVIKFGTTRGIHQLCETGPTENSKISAPADIPVLHFVTAVFSVTPEAQKALEEWNH